jgi:hypothetical protein
MNQQKIMTAITSAISHLENSLKTMAKDNDEKDFDNSIWLAAAETEYALFLFSFQNQDASNNPSWKHDSIPKQMVDVQSALVSTQDILKGAVNSIETGSWAKAYEETRSARYILLRVEELLDKKRKSGATKTKGAAILPP